MTPFSATFSMGMPSTDAVYTQGSAVAYAEQDLCKMIDLSGSMDAYSPSCNLATDGCESFGSQLPLYFPEDCPDIAKGSFVMTTRDTDVSQYPVECLSNDPSDTPVTHGDVNSHDTAGGWSPSEAHHILGLDLPTTGHASQAPKCRECGWMPKPDGRSAQKLKQAVLKHVKRYHDARDYKCELCGTVIQKRRDNFKDHVRKRHPAEFPRLYPGPTGKRRQSECVSYGPPPTPTP